MKKMYKVTWILAKAVEILMWTATVCALAGVLISLIKPALITDAMAAGKLVMEDTKVGGVSFGVFDASVKTGILFLFFLTMFFYTGLTAMVARNIYLMFGAVLKGNSPFSADMVRMVREIGIFLVSGVAVGLIISVVARAVIGYETAEVSANITNLLPGVVVLCLSGIFSYGADLQKEVDELL